MKGYIISVMLVSFLGGGVMAIAPKGENKNLRLLCSICALGCVVFPIFSLLGGISDDFDKNAIIDMFEIGEDERQSYEEIYNQYLQSAELSQIEKLLKSQAISELSLKEESFDIMLSIDKNSDKFYISSAKVIIYFEGLTDDPRELKKYIEKMTGCVCEIYYDIK